MTHTGPSGRSLSDLGALLAYRNRPEHFEPLQSNWTTDPAEAKVETEVRRELHGERLARMEPSIEAIYREMHHEPERNGDGQIVAIGKLRFSDGTQTEKADMIGPDGAVIQYDRRMPTGAMLGCTERLTDSAGGGKSPAGIAISNAALADRMGVNSVRYIPGKRKRKGRSYTRDESQAIIDQAVANTAIMPPVTKCPPGLPTGTAQSSDCFIGMKIGSTGKGGGISWEDGFEAQREREAWLNAERELSEKDRRVLGAAIVAGTYADVGISIGQGPEYARRRGGRLALVAANDNLAAAVKKYVA